MGAPKNTPTFFENAITGLIKKITWSNFEKIIILAIIIPISVSVVNSYYSDFIEKQNLAQAYRTEILWLEPIVDQAIVSPDSHLTFNPDGSYTVLAGCSPNQLYPDWGMFHKNSLAISKFDRKLSEQLYTYYFSIQWAEENRKIICSQGLLLKDMDRQNEGNTSTYRAIADTLPINHKELVGGSKLCKTITPTLLENLNKTIDAKPFIFF